MKLGAVLTSLTTDTLISSAAAQTGGQMGAMQKGAMQTGSAAPSTYLGIHTLGAQVTHNTGHYALRLGSGGRTIVLVYGNGVGLDADVLFPISGSLDTPTRFSLGGGLDLNAYASGVFNCGITGPCAPFPTVISVRPHVLAQYEWRANPKLTLFTEGSLGYAVSTVGNVVHPGFRLGLNFR